MLGWSLMFFVVAVLAAVLGFGGVAFGAAAVARICFYVFVAVFLASLIWQLVVGRRSSPPV